MDNCGGQSYDGAVNMAGRYAGALTLIQHQFAKIILFLDKFICWKLVTQIPGSIPATGVFRTARVDLNSIKIDPCPFGFYFALCIFLHWYCNYWLSVFLCSRKNSWKNSSFGVQVFRCFVV